MIALLSLLLGTQISHNRNSCTTNIIINLTLVSAQVHSQSDTHRKKKSFQHRPTQKRMCTQEIVWCSCGHGEFLPIIKCPQAEALGVCFTVVHGDHRVVLPMECSYCISGQSERTALNTNARPQGELAAMIERKNGMGNLGDGVEDGVAANTAGDVPAEVEDVVSADWSGFDLDPELWQYV